MKKEISMQKPHEKVSKHGKKYSKLSDKKLEKKI